MDEPYIIYERRRYIPDAAYNSCIHNPDCIGLSDTSYGRPKPFHKLIVRRTEHCVQLVFFPAEMLVVN